MAGILGLLMSGAGLIKDQYFNLTTLLLPGNGTNGAQNNTFLDGSTNNFTITRNGNTTQGTFSPFSQTGWGNYFDGSGDYLSVADNVALRFGTGDFTIEFWYNGTLGTLSQYCVSKYTTFTTAMAYVVAVLRNDHPTNPRGVFVFVGNTSFLVGSNIIQNNTWYHIAVTRESGSVKVFVNGVQIGSTQTITNDITDTAALRIGASNDSDSYVLGYVSNTRIVKGTAVYTSAFTPPTSPLTAISGTSLLTCQSNRFKDNSSNNFTITVNGNTSVVAFSPFAPTAAYTTAAVGGSGYFDGTGDYLTVPTSADFNLGTGAFTFETWVNPTASGAKGIFQGSSAGLIIQINASNKAVVRLYAVADLITSTDSIALNTWTHIAVARSGTTLSMWINGSRSAGGTVTDLSNFAQTGFVIGASETFANQFSGYMSNLRLVKGTAVYDPTQSSITVPTSPLTAVSGTSLLLNFTNAGITDATAKNDLETVGNAQISTSVSKVGGGSIAFDGTGDYLITDNSDNILGFGTGDWTIEFWLRLNSTGTQVIFDGRRSSASNVAPLVYYSSGLKYYTAGGDRISGGTLSTGVWYYIAIVKSSGSTRMYIDGSQTGSTYTDGNNYIQQSQRPIIGAEGVSVGSNPLNGYIDDLRITKGYARTVTTVPTAPFPVQ